MTLFIEIAFCCRCMKVVRCDVKRTYDLWIWQCKECGARADEEWIDNEDDE